MIALIDNYDSFTFNLVHYLGGLGADVAVHRNDKIAIGDVLVVERGSLPNTLSVTAETDDGLIMGLSHKTRPVHGVQFHPESIASEHGHLMLKNFLELAAEWNVSRGRKVH